LGNLQVQILQDGIHGHRHLTAEGEKMKTVYEDMTEDAELLTIAVREGRLQASTLMVIDSILAKRDALPMLVATMDAEDWRRHLDKEEAELGISEPTYRNEYGRPGEWEAL